MGWLSDLANIIAVFAGITYLIDRWPQMIKSGKPYLPKIGLIFMIVAVICAGLSNIATRHISLSKIQRESGLSKEQEVRVKKLIQDNIREMQNKESSLRVKYVMPQLGENAVLKLPLENRPNLDLSDEEIRKIYKISRSATGKILKYESQVNSYDDLMKAAVQTHMDYEKNLFSGENKN